MAVTKLLLGASLLATGSAHWGGGTCPYLAKVVPDGESRIDAITNLLAVAYSNCSAFSEQFSETGTFETICGRDGHKMTFNTREETKDMCDKAPQMQLSLKSVFPDFSSGNVIFVMRAHCNHPGDIMDYDMLWKAHWCPRSKKLTHANAILGVSEFLSDTTRSAGNSFVKRVLAGGDCTAFEDMAESNVIVQLYGSPRQLVKGGDTKFSSIAEVKAACEEKVAKESHFYTVQNVQVDGHYYNAEDRELTVVVTRLVESRYLAPKLSERPVVVVLGFSASGLIRHVFMYETEVVHLEKKWAATYGVGAHKALPEPEVPQSNSALAWVASIFGKEAVSAAPAPIQTVQMSAQDLTKVKEKKCAALEGKTDEDLAQLLQTLAGTEIRSMCAEEEFKKLSVDEKHAKCEWLRAELSKGQTDEVAELKAKSWYLPLHSACASLEVSSLAVEARQKKCIWWRETKQSGQAEAFKREQYPMWRALSEACSEAVALTVSTSGAQHFGIPGRFVQLWCAFVIFLFSFA